MKPQQLATFLAKAIVARLPVLITGKPGIGKSQIVGQATDSVGARMILSHPAVADPTDAKGLPWMAKDGESATFLPFGELAEAMRATEPTVWFLDDLGQATPAVQASFMQLLLARRVNGHRLPDCVTFVAATNRRVDRAGVTGILEPVKSRFASIVELETDLDEWTQWAFRHGIAPEVIAYLRFQPDSLDDFRPTADLTNSPVPRTWESVSNVLALDLPNAIRAEAIAGAISDGEATKFEGFLTLYRELPSIDGILVDPNTGAIPDKPATLYAVTAALATRATVENFSRIARYAERLVETGNGEFAALLLLDSQRKNEEIAKSTDFIRLMAGDLGQLIGGTRS